VPLDSAPSSAPALALAAANFPAHSTNSQYIVLPDLTFVSPGPFDLKLFASKNLELAAHSNASCFVLKPASRRERDRPKNWQMRGKEVDSEIAGSPELVIYVVGQKKAKN
jgi:hypothetical protein